MIYRLKELKGDTIAVPQLVFSSWALPKYNVRVALYVLATGVTDPDKICADLKLRSASKCRKCAGFLGRCRAFLGIRGKRRAGRRARCSRPHEYFCNMGTNSTAYYFSLANSSISDFFSEMYLNTPWEQHYEKPDGKDDSGQAGFCEVFCDKW